VKTNITVITEDISRLLSAPRIEAYRMQTVEQTLESALDLYCWNLRMSAAFYESIHYLEVALRNTIDTAMHTWHQGNHADGEPWYRCISTPLRSEARVKVIKAMHYATEQGARQEVHGRVLTELSFGFWRSLLSGSYNRSLWEPILRHSFPQVRRGKLFHAMGVFLTIRNRISHGEPIHRRNLEADYRLLVKTSGFIHPSLQEWIVGTSPIPTELENRPGIPVSNLV